MALYDLRALESYIDLDEMWDRSVVISRDRCSSPALGDWSVYYFNAGLNDDNLVLIRAVLIVPKDPNEDCKIIYLFVSFSAAQKALRRSYWPLEGSLW